MGGSPSRPDLGGKFDVRVSVLPVIHGEKVVMRLLDQSEITLGSITPGSFRSSWTCSNQ